VARLIRHPLVHFLVVGAVVFAARSGLTDGFDAREPLVLSRERVAALSADWQRMTGAPPSAAERDDLIEREIEDEICFREALRLGLDRGSSLVSGRLAALMRFLGETEARDDDLVREARRLGLDRTDLVIRRHLVEDIRLRVEQAGDPAPVPDAELAERLEREASEHRRPERVRLVHVFFDAGRREGLAEAGALAEELRAGVIEPGATRALGDPFIHGLALPLLSGAELESRFGRAFARAALGLPVGEWAGPIESPYGFHVVRVEERREASLPGLTVVRRDVERRIRRERGIARYRERLAAWRERYRILVEDRDA
jgi:PPIC-type PPIASE domain